MEAAYTCGTVGLNLPSNTMNAWLKSISQFSIEAS